MALEYNAMCWYISSLWKEGKPMTLKRAGPADLKEAARITRETILAVYPHYYPKGIVDFFLNWHREEKILPDILAGEVFLLLEEGKAVGTVTLHGEEITRLYVPPLCQGKGYGRFLLDFAERTLGEAYGRMTVEASLPAKALYLRRGYRIVDYRTEEQENGDVLCWDVMEKTWAGEKAALEGESI